MRYNQNELLRMNKTEKSTIDEVKTFQSNPEKVQTLSLWDSTLQFTVVKYRLTVSFDQPCESEFKYVLLNSSSFASFCAGDIVPKGGENDSKSSFSHIVVQSVICCY